MPQPVVPVLLLTAIAFVVLCAASFSTESVSNALPPLRGGYFEDLPPEAALPTDEECASRVHRSLWEPRPENYRANRTTPPSDLQITAPWGGDPRAEAFRSRVTGQFTGTTDEILQWGACKWGFRDERVRALAFAESSWRMNKIGDFSENPEHCLPGYQAPCPTSFGITQVKHFVHLGTWPWAQESTAFAVDYALAMQRACFEGWLWMGEASRGDVWGCVGLWYSGTYGEGYDEYVASVKKHELEAPWLRG